MYAEDWAHFVQLIPIFREHNFVCVSETFPYVVSNGEEDAVIHYEKCLWSCVMNDEYKHFTFVNIIYRVGLVKIYKKQWDV
jgi:hypothetical protein